MRRLKLYLETSVWNFLFADDAPEKKSVTELFFNEVKRGKYAVYISTAVIQEINRAAPEMKHALAQTIETYAPIYLDETDEVRELVGIYLKNGLLSNKHIEDITHAAIATVFDMDMLVSWNMRHLVKYRTRTMVNAINSINGYRDIDICTPEEVIEYETNT